MNNIKVSKTDTNEGWIFEVIVSNGNSTTHKVTLTNEYYNHLGLTNIDPTKLVYAISDRDTYRRLIEVYLDDGILSRTEQILLWDERRKLGISELAHDRLLNLLVSRYQSQGRPIHIPTFNEEKSKITEDNNDYDDEKGAES